MIQLKVSSARRRTETREKRRDERRDIGNTAEKPIQKR